MILEESKSSKWAECEYCIYFQEKADRLADRYNSAIDIAFELNKFINECNICKEITKC